MNLNEILKSKNIVIGLNNREQRTITFYKPGQKNEYILKEIKSNKLKANFMTLNAKWLNVVHFKVNVYFRYDPNFYS